MFDNLKIGDQILIRVSLHGFDSIWEIYKGELVHVQQRLPRDAPHEADAPLEPPQGGPRARAQAVRPPQPRPEEPLRLGLPFVHLPG